VDFGSVLSAQKPTATPLIITATPLPATATLPPTEALLVASPTVGQAVILVPSATPIPPTPLIQLLPSATPEVAPVGATTPPQTTGGNTATGALNLPSLLIGNVTALSRINGGTFRMGTTFAEVKAAVDECTQIWNAQCKTADGDDSIPEHGVTVDSYYIETKEVTYSQYLSFLNSANVGMGPNSHRTGCNGQLCLLTRSEDPNSNVQFNGATYTVLPVIVNFPVAGVTWYGAQAYCAALGRRLPSEAEWEHAARGDANTLYAWPTGAGEQFDTTRAKTSRPVVTDAAQVGAVSVGSYVAGNNNLYDMAGNLAEWVSDWYSPTYYTQLSNLGVDALNPTGPAAGTQKVVRGGSWTNPPFFARTVHRLSADPITGGAWIGFRCAASLDANTPGVEGNASASTGVVDANTTALATLPPSLPASGGTSEEPANAAPTLAPPPIQPTALPIATLPEATLSPG
jgi:formylglycine-generating enzyme required for sulfatase activity